MRSEHFVAIKGSDQLSPFALCHLLARQKRLQQGKPKGLRLLRPTAHPLPGQANGGTPSNFQGIPMPSKLPASVPVQQSSMVPAKCNLQDIEARVFAGIQALRALNRQAGCAVDQAVDRRSAT